MNLFVRLMPMDSVFSAVLAIAITINVSGGIETALLIFCILSCGDFGPLAALLDRLQWRIGKVFLAAAFCICAA